MSSSINSMDSFATVDVHVPPKITRYLDDAEKGIKPNRKTVLQVVDAPHDGTMPLHLVELEFNGEGIGTMQNLPPHEPKTARIFDITVHRNFQANQEAQREFQKFFQDEYSLNIGRRQLFRRPDDPLLVNDIGSISSQWSQSPELGRTNLFCLTNRTSLQQQSQDYDVFPENSTFTCIQDMHDRSIVIMVNSVSYGQNYKPRLRLDHYIPFRNPRCISRLLDGTSWTTLSDGSAQTFTKLLVLDFFITSVYLQPVDYYDRLMYPDLDGSTGNRATSYSLARNAHLQIPLGIFEPSLSTSSKDAFKEIEDAEDVAKNIENLADSIDFVTEALGGDADPDVKWPHRKELNGYLKDLNNLCKERRNRAHRTLQAHRRQLDYVTKRETIREADLVKILTILASIYLPLSLSASLLGMQYPFKLISHDHVPDGDDRYFVGTNLLFDFFGISIGLGTVTIFIFWAIRFAMWFKFDGLVALSNEILGPHSTFLYRRQWQYEAQGGRLFGFVYVLTRWWTGAGFLIALPAVFLVGMLGSAKIAWDAAKWTFTAYAAGGGAFVLGLVITYRYLYYRKVRARTRETG